MNEHHLPPVQPPYQGQPNPGNVAHTPQQQGNVAPHQNPGENQGWQRHFGADGQPVDSVQRNQSAERFGGQAALQGKYVGPLGPHEIITPDMSPESRDKVINSFARMVVGQTATMNLPSFGNSQVTLKGRGPDGLIYDVTPLAPRPSASAPGISASQPMPPQPRPQESFGPRGSANANVAPLGQPASALGAGMQQGDRRIGVGGQPPVARRERGAEDDVYGDPLNASKNANGGAVIGGGSQVTRNFSTEEAPAEEIDLGFGRSSQQLRETGPKEQKDGSTFTSPAAPAEKVGARAAAKAQGVEVSQSAPPQETAPAVPVDEDVEGLPLPFVVPEVPDIKTRETRPGHLRTTQYE